MDGTSYYARTEHGGYPVTRLSRGVKIEWPQGPQVYLNTRTAIKALYCKAPLPPPGAYDPHLCFDRYFRQGRYAKHEYPSVDVFDLFKPDPPLQVTISPVRPPLSVHTGLTVFVPSPVGIDLSKRAGEVRKLFYAGFARRVLRYGYDPEEVLQEVYKGIIIRNEGICPFDPAKSSFGHYVHMVTGCILSNYRRKYSRLSKYEQLGLKTYEEESEDVAESNLSSEQASQEEHCEYRSALHYLEKLSEEEASKGGLDPLIARKCVTLRAEGYKLKEITQKLGVSPSVVTGAIQIVRGVASRWRVSI